MKWKAKGKTLYVDDATNSKGWKGLGWMYSEKNAQIVADVMNQWQKNKKEISDDNKID